MKVIVGSLNPIKINAIKDAFCAHKTDAEISGTHVSSHVSAQPISLDEIIRGARNRAQQAFNQCDLSVGVESGIFYVHDKHYDTCHVALFDGKTFYEGGSPYFEIPQRIVHSIMYERLELGNFFDGKEQGAIGVLTQGLITRQHQLTQAAILALARYRNKDYS